LFWRSNCTAISRTRILFCCALTLAKRDPTRRCE
jgi:hypothetical protein